MPIKVKTVVKGESTEDYITVNSILNTLRETPIKVIRGMPAYFLEELIVLAVDEWEIGQKKKAYSLAFTDDLRMLILRQLEEEEETPLTYQVHDDGLLHNPKEVIK